MKKGILFAGLLAGFAGNTMAVPYVEVNFYQDNWYIYLTIEGKDLPVEHQADLYVDGIYMSSSTILNSGYLPAHLLSMFSPGEHTVTMTYDDLSGVRQPTILGPTYTITQPTGDRPTTLWFQQDPLTRPQPPADLQPLPQPTPEQVAAFATVPDGGATALMLGLGVLGLMSLRRNPS